MSDRQKIKEGDYVEITLRFKVRDIDRFDHVYSDSREGSPFTSFTFEHGAPVIRDGRVAGNIWTVEIPDEYGRVILLGSDRDE